MSTIETVARMCAVHRKVSLGSKGMVGNMDSIGSDVNRS